MFFPDLTKVRLVVEAMSALQGTKPADKQWNDRLTCVLETLGIKQRASDHRVCTWNHDRYIVLLNLSEDDALIVTSNPKALQVVNNTIAI